jgi:hypothetical protein
MNHSANDNEASPDRELLRLFEYLDRTAVPLTTFGCYVAVSDDKSAIFVCSMLADGSPEIDDDSGHMSWSQVTAPDSQFVQVVNSLFNTTFQVAGFCGR